MMKSLSCSNSSQGRWTLYRDSNRDTACGRENNRLLFGFTFTFIELYLQIYTKRAALYDNLVCFLHYWMPFLGSWQPSRRLCKLWVGHINLIHRTWDISINYFYKLRLLNCTKAKSHTREFIFCTCQSVLVFLLQENDPKPTWPTPSPTLSLA